MVAQYASSGAIVRTHSVHLIGQRPSSTDVFLHNLHNRVGLAIGVLMRGRLALRFSTGAPAPSHALRGWASRLTQGVHYAFYLVLITESATGAIAAYFWWPISSVHVILFKILLGLVIVHVMAALWHEFGVRDGNLRRMLFLPAASTKSKVSNGPGRIGPI